jgi:LacI family transcriptional regulator, galactose operon repressor
MSKSTCVGLAFTFSYSLYRSVLRGIRRYAETKPQWRFASIAPDHLLRGVPRWSRPDGLIASVYSKPMARTLARSRRPVVNVAAILDGLRFPRVGIDNVKVGQLAAAHFLERGLRHLGFIGPQSFLFAKIRAAAFSQAVVSAGYSVACYETGANLPFDALGQRWDVDPGVLRWLRSLPKPVGIFTPGDLWGVQVAEACRHAALRVPEDVAILGVEDDDLYCELSRPHLSSIILPAERLGYEAAELLDRLMDGKAPPREAILLPPIGVATRRSTEVLAVDDLDVVAAVRFIREYAHLPLRVADVLAEVPVGRRTLERGCRRALGHGLSDEIRRTRLERARRLLVETDLPLKVLAEQAGFSDYHHLAVAFRRQLGLTPTAYRRQLRSPFSFVIQNREEA